MIPRHRDAYGAVTPLSLCTIPGARAGVAAISSLYPLEQDKEGGLGLQPGESHGDSWRWRGWQQPLQGGMRPGLLCSHINLQL